MSLFATHYSLFATMADKLTFFYSPGSCALASHIALEEAEAEFGPLPA
jgi:hypothetical protein